jgi:hypothetical protein
MCFVFYNFIGLSFIIKKFFIFSNKMSNYENWFGSTTFSQGSSTNPHPAKSPLPYANLLKLCHKICVGTVEFLAQIRLEIQLYWDFKWLEIGDLTEYLESAYENRQDIYWSDQFFKGLIDFTKTVDKVHKHMQHFPYAFRESEDYPQAKYLTSIFEVAQFALLSKNTNGNGAFFMKNLLASSTMGKSDGCQFVGD